MSNSGKSENIDQLYGEHFIIDRELNSDESSDYNFDPEIIPTITVLSIVSATKIINISNINLDYYSLRPGNKIILSGVDPESINGKYTIDSLPSNSQIKVIENILDGTGGTLIVRHESGERLVGVNSIRFKRLFINTNNIHSINNLLDEFMENFHPNYVEKTEDEDGNITQIDEWYNSDKLKRYTKIVNTYTDYELTKIEKSYYKSDGITENGKITINVVWVGEEPNFTILRTGFGDI